MLDTYRMEPRLDPKVFKSELIGQVIWDATTESKLVWADELGSDDSEEYEDDSDSNDENNWRNEYPEESDSGAGSWRLESSEYESEGYVSSSCNSDEWY